MNNKFKLIGGKIRYTENVDLIARVIAIKRQQIMNAGFRVENTNNA